MFSSQIYNKITRVYLYQVILISLVSFIGVYTATLVVEKVLIKTALHKEAQHFWTLFEKNPSQHVPNIDNLRGYIAKNNDFSLVPNELKLIEPGYQRIEFEDQKRLIYVEDRFDNRLYLIFEEEIVRMLSLYFGVVPLFIILIIIYISTWFVYRESKKTVSPIVELAGIVKKFELNNGNFSNLKIDHLSAHEPDTEIGILIDAIKVFKTRIAELIERERQFSSDASKELSKPLLLIRKTAEEFLYTDNIDNNQKINIERILSTCNDMNLLIETLLLLSHTDEPLPNKAVDVNIIIDKLVEQTDLSLNSDNHVKFNVVTNSQLFVNGHSQAIAIVLGNLIRNACLYTQKGKIEITINRNSVIVKDTGHGMPEEEIQELIKPFTRSILAEEITGYGLGLDIVKRLCELFSWEISINSSLGGGTSISLFFLQDDI